MLKAEGYESQSFERKHATLFNCTKPDWVSAKKKMIGPVFASKEVLNLHAKSIGMHTQRLMAIVCGGQPCDMSAIGQCELVLTKKRTLLTPPSLSLQSRCDVLHGAWFFVGLAEKVPKPMALSITP